MQPEQVIDEQDLLNQIVELLSPLVSPRPATSRPPAPPGQSFRVDTPRGGSPSSQSHASFSESRVSPAILCTTPASEGPESRLAMSPALTVATPSPPLFPPLLRRGPPSPIQNTTSHHVPNARGGTRESSSSSSRTSTPLEGIREEVVLEWATVEESGAALYSRRGLYSTPTAEPTTVALLQRI